MHSRRRGVTLMEMLIVMAIIGLLAGITFPSVASGIDSVRLASATDSIAGFFNAGLNRAERRQELVEITISRAENALTMRSSEPGFYRRIELPSGVSLVAVLPEIPADSDAPRRVVLFPGGVTPRIGVEIANRRGTRRIVRVDPITGVPQIERPEAQ